jgi:hypothetical protein
VTTTVTVCSAVLASDSWCATAKLKAMRPAVIVQADSDAMVGDGGQLGAACNSQKRQYQLDILSEKLQSWPWALPFDESLISVVELASGRIDLELGVELSCLGVPASWIVRGG